METPPPPKSFSLLPFATHAARGFIREQTARRKIMLAAVLGAVALMVAGATIMRGVLDHHTHPACFILYWLACAWLTILALLLALFDLLIVRAQARAAREQLRDQIASKRTPDSQTDTSEG